MKTELMLFVVGAAILGGSSAALARGEGSRPEQPRITHAQQHNWGSKQTANHRNVHGVGHAASRMVNKSGHHGVWSYRHPRSRGNWSHRHPHDKYARYGHYYHPIPHGRIPARPYRHSINGLSIIIHGHF
jgi:hypothetical protein